MDMSSSPSMDSRLSGTATEEVVGDRQLVIFQPEVENRDPNDQIDQKLVSKRAVQQVATKVTKRNVVAWMIEDATINGDAKVISRAVKMFPEHFVGNTKANLQKASRWWKSQDQILEEEEPLVGNEVSTICKFQRKKCALKASAGRGCKRAAWVTWLYNELLKEIERLQKEGVKFSTTLLGDVARDILRTSDSEFNSNTIDPKDGVPIISKICKRWVHLFMDRHNMVLQRQTGMLTCRQEKEPQREQKNLPSLEGKQVSALPLAAMAEIPATPMSLVDFLKAIDGFDNNRAEDCSLKLAAMRYDTVDVLKLATKQDLVEDAGILPGDALRIIAAAKESGKHPTFGVVQVDSLEQVERPVDKEANCSRVPSEKTLEAARNEHVPSANTLKAAHNEQDSNAKPDDQNVPAEENPDSDSKAKDPLTLTFWTSCPLCQMQYQYLSSYSQFQLLCPKCNKPFLAKSINQTAHETIDGSGHSEGTNDDPDNDQVSKKAKMIVEDAL